MRKTLGNGAPRLRRRILLNGSRDLHVGSRAACDFRCVRSERPRTASQAPLRSALFRCREHRAGARRQSSACCSLIKYRTADIDIRSDSDDRRLFKVRRLQGSLYKMPKPVRNIEPSVPQQHVSRHWLDQRPDTVCILDYIVTWIVQSAIEPGRSHVTIGVRQQAP